MKEEQILIFYCYASANLAIPDERSKNRCDFLLAGENRAYIIEFVQRRDRCEIVDVEIKYLVTQLGEHRVVELEE